VETAFIGSKAGVPLNDATAGHRVRFSRRSLGGDWKTAIGHDVIDPSMKGESP